MKSFLLAGSLESRGLVARLLINVCYKTPVRWVVSAGGFAWLVFFLLLTADIEEEDAEEDENEDKGEDDDGGDNFVLGGLTHFFLNVESLEVMA